MSVSVESTSILWDVHKFGGTSVGSAECIRRCIEIIKPKLKTNRIAMVVSAMGGKPKVTDLLLDSVHAAAAGNINESDAKLNGIQAKHELCVRDILAKSPEMGQILLDKIKSDLKDIKDLLRAVTLMRMAHEQILELVSGYGEIWSASIISEVLRQEGLPFIFLNARDVLVVSEGELGTKVHWEESEEKLQQILTLAESNFKKDGFTIESDIPVPHLVITGYVASTVDGVATTLKRDGSDFSASIFGKMLRSCGITIWTDVSGVYSADPRRVPEAEIIPEVSYTEAIELAYFGAKVIHPKTMAPAILAQIPIYIRNTFEPSHHGTRIYAPSVKGSMMREKCVCGFSTVDNIALLNLEGTGMMGVPGIAHRLFGALKGSSISVMFIAQASSEQSICFAIKESQMEAAVKSVEEAFFYEFKQGLVNTLRTIGECSIIAAVGEKMSNMPGVAGLFFGALGNARINILSISQGCDEKNISAVVYAKDSARALRAVHAAFLLSTLDISIGIVGVGRVGTALIQTLLEQLRVLKDRYGISIKIRGLMNTSTMLLGDDLSSELKSKMHIFQRGTKHGTTVRNESFQDLTAAVAAQGSVESNIQMFFDHIVNSSTPHAIIIDCTNSANVANLHPIWLTHGAHVITANKLALSSSLSLYNAVYSAAKTGNRSYMSEVTIGASIPVLTTLNDLLCSGDTVNSIIGLMSVSVGMLLTDISESGLSLSAAIANTYSKGLFEEDPFLDLDGKEAGQKLLILARELGIPLNIEDVEIEPLVSQELFAVENSYMKQRVTAAAEKGCVLRYIQRIECEAPVELGGPVIRCKASSKLEDVPLDSSYAHVRGAVYHFAFHTARYASNPLVVQGPLSDSANTASGMVGDMLRIARFVGAKDKGRNELKISEQSIYSI
eukprot:gene5902-11914_t